MPRPRLDEIVRLTRSGFDGVGEFSLLECLGSVDDAAWTALPPGGHRSIRDLVHHVGMFKLMYANHAFGDAAFTYDDPPATPPAERLATPAAAADWLREGHAYLLAAVDGLRDDAELAVPRRAHWGALVPTEALLTVMVQHDPFHAGEINHLRALLTDTDRWYVPAP